MKPSERKLKAPFPYHGGKGRWVDIVWPRLGMGDAAPTVYVEPFAGSLAVLLASEPHQREIIADTSYHVVNFWRSVQDYPDAVAYWADRPTFHSDLTARHRWLLRWGEQLGPLLDVEANFCDPKAAGWWCWGVSNWIGGGFAEGTPVGARPFVCDDGYGRGVQAQNIGGQVPRVSPMPGGRGVQAQNIGGQVPRVSPMPGGHGVSVQREPWDQIPQMGTPRGVQPQRAPDGIPMVRGSNLGGRGVSAQRDEVPDAIPKIGHFTGGHGVTAQRKDTSGSRPSEKRPHVQTSAGGQGVQPRPAHAGYRIGTGDRLRDWMYDLQDRLSRVVTLNRSWESAVTPTLLMHTPSSPKPPVAVFLDPPYRTDQRSTSLYGSDLDGTSEDAAVASYRWAIQHGDVYRIAYAMHEGDFEVPEGWTSVEMSFRKGGAGRQDQIIFSPACLIPDGLLEIPRLL